MPTLLSLGHGYSARALAALLLDEGWTVLGTTRSAAAVDLWVPRLEGAVVAIGNAPTALFHLLELLDQGWPRPAAIRVAPGCRPRSWLGSSCDMTTRRLTSFTTRSSSA